MINICARLKEILPKLCPVSRQWNMRYMLVKYATLMREGDEDIHVC